MKTTKQLEKVKLNITDSFGWAFNLRQGVIPAWRKEVAELTTQVKQLENEIERIEWAYDNDDWEVLLRGLEDDAWKIDRKLKKAFATLERYEDALAEIDYALDQIFYHSQDAIRAVKA